MEIHIRSKLSDWSGTVREFEIIPCCTASRVQIDKEVFRVELKFGKRLIVSGDDDKQVIYYSCPYCMVPTVDKTEKGVNALSIQQMSELLTDLMKWKKNHWKEGQPAPSEGYTNEKYPEIDIRETEDHAGVSEWVDCLNFVLTGKYAVVEGNSGKQE